MKTFKMKMLIFLAFAMAISLSSAQESTLEFENAESSVQIVKDYVTALQSGDVAKMNQYLSEDAMVYNLGGGRDSLNPKQHREYYTNSTNTYTHSISRDLYLPVKVTNNWNEGEWVLAWGTNTVTNKKNGKVSVIPYHTATIFENGKIKAIHYFYDMSNIMKTQGWTMTPPKE